MAKRQNTILIWIITWTGLLVAVLYSPIGSPDLYKSSHDFELNNNVNPSVGGVENDQNISFESRDEYDELNIPDYSTDESSSKFSSSKYNYITAGSSTISSDAASYASYESQSYQNLKNGSSGGVGAVSGSFTSSSSSGAAASSVLTTTDGGTSSLFSLTMNLSSKSSQYLPASGGQNPGGDPDANTRIPVPDGCGILLLLATSYGILKKKFFRS